MAAEFPAEFRHITGEILQGTQRPSLTLNKLTDLAALPWNEQLRLLEFVA